MRRLLLTLLAASSIAFLPACSSGGSVYGGSNSNIDHVLIQSNGQEPGVLKVAPGGSITLSAVGVSGSANVVVNADQNYLFSFEVAPAGTQAPNGVSGASATCNTITGATNTPGLLRPVANTGNSVVLTAPTSLTSATTGFGPAAVTSPGTGSYCLIVNATHVSDGKVGSAVVIVSAAP